MSMKLSVENKVTTDLRIATSFSSLFSFTTLKEGNLQRPELALSVAGKWV